MQSRNHPPGVSVRPFPRSSSRSDPGDVPTVGGGGGGSGGTLRVKLSDARGLGRRRTKGGGVRERDRDRYTETGNQKKGLTSKGSPGGGTFIGSREGTPVDVRGTERRERPSRGRTRLPGPRPGSQVGRSTRKGSN